MNIRLGIRRKRKHVQIDPKLVTKGNLEMPIRVLCRDKSRGYIEASNLDDMIKRGIVVAFFRPGSNEWVDVKNNPIRKKADIGYNGVERRSNTKTTT